MSSNDTTNNSDSSMPPIHEVPHSQPINIEPSRGRQNRRRAESTSSSSDNSPPLKTPSSPTHSALSPSTSPILSYFLSQQSPTTKTSFPFNRSPLDAVEDDETETPTSPTLGHIRRVSTGFGSAMFGNGLPVGATGTLPESQQERGKGLLRRLSLGGAMKPNFQRTTTPPPPKSAGIAPSSNQHNASPRRSHRAATIGSGQSAKIPRSPSPMGERMLKGHFDGFN